MSCDLESCFPLLRTQLRLPSTLLEAAVHPRCRARRYIYSCTDPKYLDSLSESYTDYILYTVLYIIVIYMYSILYTYLLLTLTVEPYASICGRLFRGRPQASEDLEDGVDLTVAREQRLTGGHLGHKAAQRPDVRGRGVPVSKA